MTNTEATIILMDTVDGKGWEWCNSIAASEHKDEGNLLYCTIINQKNEAVSYLFNANDKAFYHGHYFNNTTEAMRYTEER
jgi:hypothetical protein